MDIRSNSRLISYYKKSIIKNSLGHTQKRDCLKSNKYCHFERCEMELKIYVIEIQKLIFIHKVEMAC